MKSARIFEKFLSEVIEHKSKSTDCKLRDNINTMTGHLYFIGIAGHAMRGLALAARDNGYRVSGLDPTAIAPGSDWLDEHQITWWRKYEPEQLVGVTAIIVTGSGVSEEHPAIDAARKAGIPVQSFAEFFGRLTSEAEVIAIAGTHGKTTTASLIAWLLESAGRHPDFLIGIQPFNFLASVRYGGSTIAVVEGDEYKASAIDLKSKVQYYHPNTLVLTSVEHDHPDMFPDLAAVEERFREIVANIPTNGQLIACAESETVMNISKSAPCQVTTYGIKNGDFAARNIAYLPAGLEFEVQHANDILGHVAVATYGHHNVLNTLAAITAVLQQGLSFTEVLVGLASFKGAYRRFNIVSAPDSDVAVIDDYAHHPTEVATNIEAVKLHFQHRRIVVIFRPHTYSRTKALLNDYQTAFDAADLAYITDIEGAREAESGHIVSGEDIVKHIRIKATYEPDRTKLVEHVQAATKPGDVILCLSVSGHDNLAEELADISNSPTT